MTGSLSVEGRILGVVEEVTMGNWVVLSVTIIYIIHPYKVQT